MKQNLMIVFIGVAAMASGPGLLSAQEASTTQTVSGAQTGFAERYPRYQIGPSDVLDIEFPLVPEFNQTVTVQPDGYISLKSTSDIHAAGLSTPQLVDAIKAAYKNILHEPIVTITLKDFEKPYFTALGKVGRPGKYELRGATTVTQAIAMAGGLDDAAKHSQVLLLRRSSPDRVEIRKLDIKHMLATGRLEEDLVIQPGDMIVVPKNTLAKVRPWIPSSGVGMYLNSF